MTPQYLVTSILQRSSPFRNALVEAVANAVNMVVSILAWNSQIVSLSTYDVPAAHGVEAATALLAYSSGIP
eukprot:gene3173-3474_t